MKKFPVTSKNGVEYEVVLGPVDDISNDYRVTLYKRYIGEYGNSHKMAISRRYFNEVTWRYDYVKMAKAIVKDYEDSIARIRRRNQEEAEGIAAFTEWGGKC